MIEEDAHKGVCVYEETIARPKKCLIDTDELLKKLDKLYLAIDQRTSQDIAQAWGVAQAIRIVKEMRDARKEKSDE